MSTEPQTKRKRNAAATRQHILTSAIDAFTRLGYDGAGVREIAEGAGVTAMLVNRYFGSKEQLFAEAVDAASAPPTIVPDHPDGLEQEMADALVRRTAPDADALGPFLIMLRSAGNPAAAAIIRDGIEHHVGDRLTHLLTGEDAELRSELLLSIIAGVWLMRHIIGTPALAQTDPNTLHDHLVSALAPLIDPPADSPDR
jgi:AcrR family transcriptional regulator